MSVAVHRIGLGVLGMGARGEVWETFERAGLDELREDGESRSAFVLRYTLTHPSAHTIIGGTTQHEHLRENVRGSPPWPLEFRSL